MVIIAARPGQPRHAALSPPARQQRMATVASKIIVCLLLCLLPLFAQAAQAVPGLLVDIHKTDIELGRTLDVQLFAVGLTRELDSIDLQPLSKDFDIARRDDAETIEDERWPDESVQRLHLKLYPRRLGSLTLPPLQLEQYRSQAKIVRVTPGQIKGQPITLGQRVSSLRPWQRQQIILWTEIATAERFASLHSDPDWTLPGFEIIPLPATRERAADGQTTLLGIGWALFPQTSGDYRIEPPPIAYRLSGKTRRQYYPSPIPLEVRALPPYVPPTLPVGKLRLDSHLLAVSPLREGTLVYWKLSLSGGGLTPRWLPPLRRQIPSNKNIQFLPAQLTRHMPADRHGVQGRVDYELPLKPLGNVAGVSRLSLPTLRLQYFDPDTGRLVSIQHQPAALWVYSPTLLMLLTGLLLIVMLTIAPRLYRHARQRWQRWQQRRQRHQALRLMAPANNPIALRTAIKSLSAAEGWPKNQSLQAWAQAWKNRYQTSKTFDELLTALSNACYGQQTDTDFATLKSSLLDTLTSPRRRQHKRPFA